MKKIWFIIIIFIACGKEEEAVKDEIEVKPVKTIVLQRKKIEKEMMEEVNYLIDMIVNFPSKEVKEEALAIFRQQAMTSRIWKLEVFWSFLEEAFNSPDEKMNRDALNIVKIVAERADGHVVNQMRDKFGGIIKTMVMNQSLEIKTLYSAVLIYSQ